MGVSIIGPKPGRNDLCPCKSGLKYKYCHGDESKKAVCNRIVMEIMLRMIMREKHKRGLMTDEQYTEFTNKGRELPEQVTEYDVGELLDKAGLKRCAGALCSAPIPDTETFCPKCKVLKLKGK